MVELSFSCSKNGGVHGRLNMKVSITFTPCVGSFASPGIEAR